MAKPSAATLAKTAAAKAGMESKIAKAAATLAVAAPSLAKTKGKTYETWVMFEVAARLAVTQKVEPRNSAGNPTKSFRVRGGPGHIRSKAEPPGKLPCHFELPSRFWEPLELHNSVEHVGVSEETHELDISVIFKRHATHIRSSAKGGPYDGPTLLGAELKAFDDQTALDKAIARALLGAIVDLNPGAVIKAVKVELRAKPDRPLTHGYGHPCMSLLTTAWITPETEKYLTAYGIDPWANVGPGQNEKYLDTLVARISSWL